MAELSLFASLIERFGADSIDNENFFQTTILILTAYIEPNEKLNMNTIKQNYLNSKESSKFYSFETFKKVRDFVDYLYTIPNSQENLFALRNFLDSTTCRTVSEALSKTDDPNKVATINIPKLLMLCKDPNFDFNSSPEFKAIYEKGQKLLKNRNTYSEKE